MLMPAEVFVPPFGALTPERHYFLFGQPIDLAGVSPERASCSRRLRCTWMIAAADAASEFSPEWSCCSSLSSPSWRCLSR